MRASDRFCFVKNNEFVADSVALTACYGPLLGKDALALYNYLLVMADQGEEVHHFYGLLTHLGLKPAELDPALAKLMALDLLEIYQEEEVYRFLLKPAKSKAAFLSDPIYRYLLEGFIGQEVVEKMLPTRPSGKRLSASLSQVFQLDQTSISKLPQGGMVKESKTFVLDHFKERMAKEGLTFQNEKEDVLALYAISEEQKWTWYETFILAKETAVGSQISIKRMREKLSQERPQGDFSPKELALIEQAKNHKSLAFFKSIKGLRKAQILPEEDKAIGEMARLGLLDEVINIIIVYSMRQNQANLNSRYVLKIANDFSNQGIQSAEAAVLKIRSIRESDQGKSQAKNQAPKKTNVPEWFEQDYKDETSPEEAAKMQERIRQLLAANNGGE